MEFGPGMRSTCGEHNHQGDSSQLGIGDRLDRAAGEARGLWGQLRSPEKAPASSATVEPIGRFGDFESRDPETRRMFNDLQRIASADVESAHQWRDRNRQGVAGPARACMQPAPQRALSGSELRRDQRALDGKHLLRLRQGRVLRRRSARTGRVFRVGPRWNPVSRRGGRAAACGAGRAAASAGGWRLPAGWIVRNPARQLPDHRRHPSRP